MISATTLKPQVTKAGPTFRNVTLGKVYRGRTNMIPEADIYQDWTPDVPSEEQAFELWLDEVGRDLLSNLQREIEKNTWNTSLKR